MHVISKKPLREFWEKHTDSEEPLQTWYRAMEKEAYENWAQLRNAFPAVDTVDKKVVFNIGGNKYRLITVIHFDRKLVFVRHVLTHKEYDEGKWKNG